jgi:N-acetyl-anhydromuramyl-L-alanine amidase AmpD
MESKVSAHFIIDKDGTVYQCVAEDKVAWHAGNSELWGVGNVNDYSLGIELVDDDDRDKYPEQQMDSLITLVTELVAKYKIQLNRIIGHQYIALPLGRKKDPGPDFPWYEFLNTLGARVSDTELKNEGK